MVDGLIADAGANDKFRLRYRLVVSKNFQFDVSAVFIREEYDPLCCIKTGCVVVDYKVELLRSTRNIDRLIA